jgi:hypothetical protein
MANFKKRISPESLGKPQTFKLQVTVRGGRKGELAQRPFAGSVYQAVMRTGNSTGARSQSLPLQVAGAHSWSSEEGVGDWASSLCMHEFIY